AKAPKVMGDVKPSTFILDTAAQRLKQHIQKAGSGNDTVPKLAVKAVPAPTATVARAAPGAPAAGKAVPTAPRVASLRTRALIAVRLAKADTEGAPTTVTAEYGDLKTAPAAGDQRVREFGSAAARPPLRASTRTLK